jgi:wyosine [tRNA(Phe)-imidazoG37] synthetase (radical SAM superfamily)
VVVWGAEKMHERTAIAVAMDAQGRVWKDDFCTAPCYMIFDQRGEPVEKRVNPYMEDQRCCDAGVLFTDLLGECGVVVAWKVENETRRRLIESLAITPVLTEVEDPLEAVQGHLGESKSLVYGPVPSRRLGQSLGVDPIPFKTCNYNCVYCQLGRTKPLSRERRDFYPPLQILAQAREALGSHRPSEVDYATFVGQGEPTLCASLGRLIREIKAMTDVPVAVITNGSLLYRADVREELATADVVMPSLDAADQATFRRINRPWPRLRIDKIIEGMAAFRKMSEGQLWIEVMLVKGLNDGEQTLLHLRDALDRIRPDNVQINVPIRPPAETWVEVPDDEAIERAVAILGEAADLVAPYEGTFDLSGSVGIADAVEAIIRRHPMRERRLVETLSRFVPGDVSATLAKLERSGRARRRVYRNETFWEYVGGSFGETTRKSHRDP